jgi:hypothetical protein
MLFISMMAPDTVVSSSSGLSTLEQHLRTNFCTSWCWHGCGRSVGSQLIVELPVRADRGPDRNLPKIAESFDASICEIAYESTSPSRRFISRRGFC